MPFSRDDGTIQDELYRELIDSRLTREIHEPQVKPLARKTLLAVTGSSTSNRASQTTTAIATNRCRCRATTTSWMNWLAILLWVWTAASRSARLSCDVSAEGSLSSVTTLRAHYKHAGEPRGHLFRWSYATNTRLKLKKRPTYRRPRSCCVSI